MLSSILRVMASPHLSFCGCANCTRFDFSHCLMHGLGGMDTKLQSVKAGAPPTVMRAGAPPPRDVVAMCKKCLAV